MVNKVENMIEKVKTMDENDVEKLIESLKGEDVDSVTLSEFIQEYLHKARYCVLETNSHIVLLVNFLENIDQMITESINFVNKVEKLIGSRKTR